MAVPEDESMDWLKALDKRVAAVTAELADLRKKNRSLVAKVNRLERQARERTEGEKASWASEKADLKQRVESLAGNLELLLED